MNLLTLDYKQLIAVYTKLFCLGSFHGEIIVQRLSYTKIINYFSFVMF